MTEVRKKFNFERSGDDIFGKIFGKISA